MPWDYPPSHGPWHRWFAWHPVKTRSHGWRWLTTVQRRQVKSLRTHWQYCPSQQETP